MKDENSKYITPEEASDYMCPFKDTKIIKCRGALCMARKWAAYENKQKLISTLSLCNNLRYNKVITKKINTHGCCGLVYTGEIKTHEFIPTI